MAPTGILSLPLETTQEIGRLVPEDLKTLRLVCSQFNLALEYDALSTLVISISERTSFRRSKCQLEGLASKENKVAHFARSLKIKCLSPYLLPVSKQDIEDASKILHRDWTRTAMMQVKQFLRPTLSSSQRKNKVAVEAVIKQYLGPAISSLKNLEHVQWVINGSDPSWTQHTVIDSLSNLSRLQDLELVLHTSLATHSDSSLPLLNLGRLSGLKKISITGRSVDYQSHIISGLAEAIAKSPQLMHLEVINTSGSIMTNHPGDAFMPLHALFSKVPKGRPLQLTYLHLNKICIPMDSFTIPHLRSLTCLDLSYIWTPSLTDDPTEFQGYGSKVITDIYATLNREAIYLKHVIIPYIDDTIIDYLSSFSGLETLEFWTHCSRDTKDSDDMSYRLYTSALPRHVETLRELNIRPQYEGGWCYNTPYASAALARCTNLRSLAVAVSFKFTLDDLFLSWYGVGDSYDHRENFGDMITSLLKMSLSFPFLTQLSIFSTLLEHSRYDIDVHDEVVRSEIGQSVTKFGLRDRGCQNRLLPDIWVVSGRNAKSELYEYQALNDGLGRGYMLSCI